MIHHQSSSSIRVHHYKDLLMMIISTILVITISTAAATLSNLMVMSANCLANPTHPSRSALAAHHHCHQHLCHRHMHPSIQGHTAVLANTFRGPLATYFIIAILASESSKISLMLCVPYFSSILAGFPIVRYNVQDI